METVNKIVQVIVNPAITLLFAVAFLYFLYGVFLFVRNADSSEDRATGGRHMLWGLIGLVIMVSVFGIIRFITNSVGVQAPKSIQNKL